MEEAERWTTMDDEVRDGCVDKLAKHCDPSWQIDVIGGQGAWRIGGKLGRAVCTCCEYQCRVDGD